MNKKIFFSILTSSVLLLSSASYAQDNSLSNETAANTTQATVESGGAVGASNGAVLNATTLAGVSLAAASIGVVLAVAGDSGDDNVDISTTGTTGTTSTTGTN